jgi:RHS repeat-associated protein
MRGTELAGIGYVADPAKESKFTYNGKEKQDQFGLGWLDYHARQVDPALGRMWAVDPHAGKYPELTTYNFVANNPMVMTDPDGKDYGVYYDHEKKTITIRAEYITRSKDMGSAQRAVATWNDKSGSFKYVVGTGKTAVAYTVNFDLKVSVDDGTPGPKFDGAQENYATCGLELSTQDNTNEVNAYDVFPDNDARFPSQGAGQQKGGGAGADYAYVREGERNDSATGAHEVGHTLGVSHEHGGLMSAVNATSGINEKHVGEILGRMGIGNTKLGGEGAGRGRVNGVVGTGFFGFNTGKVMTGRQYERMSKKQDKK